MRQDGTAELPPEPLLAGWVLVHGSFGPRLLLGFGTMYGMRHAPDPGAPGVMGQIGICGAREDDPASKEHGP